jgi:UDP-N-acetylmuramoyl-tripeptide--D-alanyl-D-alanine ligase
MHFDEKFIKKVIPQASILYAKVPAQVSFSLDTRTIQCGQLFIALEGKCVDGHGFVGEALKKGATGCIIAEHKKDLLKTLDATLLNATCIILVPDTFKALINLATAWRQEFSYPVIGITGSSGKTSTKELLAHILDVHGCNYLVSYGNQNTLCGLALNILNMRPEHEIAIFEMGINKRGEMAALAAMAKPTAAVITNVGHCHMEGLGSIIDIAAEKREIFKYFKEDSIGIINGDQPLLANIAYAHPVIKFGLKTTNQIQARKINAATSHVSFTLKLYGEKYHVILKKNHIGAVFNALAASAVSCFLNIPQETIVKGIQKLLVITSRFEQRPLKVGKGILIDDCYNANPESMKAALSALQTMKTDAQKIAVLGDMLELGVNSPFWHRQLGRFLRKVPSVRYVVLVGSMVKWTQKTIPLNIMVDIVPTWKDAMETIKQKLDQESIVLVKGSHGMELSKLVSSLT